jgi:hypothetical protein
MVVMGNDDGLVVGAGYTNNGNGGKTSPMLRYSTDSIVRYADRKLLAILIVTDNNDRVGYCRHITGFNNEYLTEHVCQYLCTLPANLNI